MKIIKRYAKENPRLIYFNLDFRYFPTELYDQVVALKNKGEDDNDFKIEMTTQEFNNKDLKYSNV